MTFNLDISKIN